MYGDLEKGKERYARLAEGQASQCKLCGKCENVCPQSLPIREHLKLVAKDLGE